MGVLERFHGSDSQRVAVLGLDGVSFSFLTEHADRFEHIDSILDEGVGAPIDSVLPPDSSTSWPSITTGLNPGETGVFGLLDREIGSYDTYVTAGSDVQAPRVWDRAAKNNLAATILNVPVTHPPQRNVQRMVSGFLATELERAAYPTDVATTLRELGYRIDVDATLGAAGELEAFLEDAYDTLDARYEVFRHYIELDDWDLFFGVFMTPDRVNHFLYGDYLEGGPLREDFLSFYEQLDTYIGALRAKLADDVVLLLISDHSFGQLEYEVDANGWLTETEWLDYREGEPADLRDIADRARAFALPRGRFYLNLEGREPRGSIPDASYEVIRAQLRDELMDWTGPDGDAVIDRVVTRETVYRGQHVDLGPDLIAIPNPGFDLNAGFSRDGPTFSKSARSGMHRESDAAFIIDHPDIELVDPSIYDITPTILSLLDVPFDRASVDGASQIA